MKKQHIYNNDDLTGKTLCGRKHGKGVSLTYAIQYDNSLGFAIDGWCYKCVIKARAIKKGGAVK